MSTIIPVYNRGQLLAEAVNSILAQSHRPIEIIIVDDGSTDDTVKVIDKLVKNNPSEVKTVRQKNTGPSLARERGRQLVQGEFIQYLDSDDLLAPKKFEWQVYGLNQYPECGVSYGKTRFYRLGESPKDIPWKRTGEKIDYMFPLFLESRWWATSSPLYRREICDRAGAWTDLSREEDWEYDCRIASQGIKLYYCDKFVSDHRDHAMDRVSRGEINTARIAQWRDRVRAYRLIYDHAIKANIAMDEPAMKLFVRYLFFVSRQCAALGLIEEAQALFKLSRSASGPVRGGGIDFKTYRFLTKIFGWRAAGQLAAILDRLRS